MGAYLGLPPPSGLSRSLGLEQAWLGGQVTELPAKVPGAEHARRQGFTGQGTGRAAWQVIPGHSAKSLGTTWPEALTSKKQPGK